MSDKPQETDVEFIRALAALLQENELAEIQVKREYGESDTLNVRVSRQIAAQAPVAAAPVAVAAALPSAPPAPAPSAAEPAAVEALDEPGMVHSPMVGTVYFQAEPGTDPFIRVGDRVEEGQTILIIEAMKTMNQIPAPRAGQIKRILVEDGSPIEFGAPLIVLE